ncbi:MAG: phosphoribosylformimino-5-aminoimidazole carboxamide ribotide isomerase [Lentisphaeria bacterium]|nr:phosphoribosylformimino-5-aminoimidazole carboxamide ribotide isomerase [Lentisphaeria bacterium]
MRFRPCIDLHDGVVKQIVGGSLSNQSGGRVVTNYIADKPPAYFASLYRENGLTGGHVIMLGAGNETAAREALSTYPGGLQVGGGVTLENAADWLAAGAAKVIITSAVFKDGRIYWDVLDRLTGAIGADRLVLDLSCRPRDGAYYVVTDRWRTFTDFQLHRRHFEQLEPFCSEFLIHAVDVEGKQQGMDETLIASLKDWTRRPVTYAGGIRNMADLLRIESLGEGEIDATVGSSLDIFGGAGMTFAEAVLFDKSRRGGITR